ncbi:MAG: GNAT family N-acetyltransferase [Clostridium sp.]|uniref:GNAT family N-acetyltransferase n=1 Tax=Clostridium sp. TaxID=1506 RepID=UPI00305491FF
MENNIKVEYVRVNRGNLSSCIEFMNLGYGYMKEVAPDKSLEIHNRFLNSVLDRQNEEERWLIGLKINNSMVGFAHFKIDKSERFGWGYILEFYIMSDFRRKGLGRKLYSFIREEFISCEIKDIWLTADKLNGEPFWFSLGFVDTDETENELKILKISI